MKISPVFAWFDLWVGVYVDRKRKRFYVFPVPMLGVCVSWAPRPQADVRGTSFPCPTRPGERCHSPVLCGPPRWPHCVEVRARRRQG